MPIETQTTIGEWALATFPGGEQFSPRHCIRLLEEVVELCRSAGASITDIAIATGKAIDCGCQPEKVPEELADCAIVLDTIAHRLGINLRLRVDDKMLTNRRRKWIAKGDGTGYHVKQESNENQNSCQPTRNSGQSQARDDSTSDLDHYQ